jgi:hypothetical protein
MIASRLKASGGMPLLVAVQVALFPLNRQFIVELLRRFPPEAKKQTLIIERHQWLPT